MHLGKPGIEHWLENGMNSFRSSWLACQLHRMNIVKETVAWGGVEELHHARAPHGHVQAVGFFLYQDVLNNGHIRGRSTQCELERCADRGEEWREGSGEAVSGVLYKAADGSERTARADLSIICDGMYSSLRSKLSTPRIRCPYPH